MKKLLLMLIFLVIFAGCSSVPTPTVTNDLSGEIIYLSTNDNTYLSLDLDTNESTIIPEFIMDRGVEFHWVEYTALIDDNLAFFTKNTTWDQDTGQASWSDEVVIYKRGSYSSPLTIFSLDQLGLYIGQISWTRNVQNPVPLYNQYHNAGLYKISLEGIEKISDLNTPYESDCTWYGRVSLSPEADRFFAYWSSNSDYCSVDDPIVSGRVLRYLKGENIEFWSSDTSMDIYTIPLAWLNNDTLIIADYHLDTKLVNLILYGIPNGDEQIIYQTNTPELYIDSVAVSPDRKYISFVVDSTNLFVYDLEHGTYHDIVSGFDLGSHQVCSPYWSPDSKWISLSIGQGCALPHLSSQNYETGIYAVKRDGSQLIPLVIKQDVLLIIGWYPPIR